MLHDGTFVQKTFIFIAPISTKTEAFPQQPQGTWGGAYHVVLQ